MSKIIIVGAGASGLTAAVVAARKGHEVIVLEKNKVGKKILLSGNGRCNYFNEDFTIKHYRSNNIEILNNFINDFNKTKVLDFMTSIGVVPRINNGYYYPYSNTSTAILNSLLVELEKHNVKIINEEVLDIKDNIVVTNNNKYKADKIVLASGSNASLKDNSNIGYKYLEKIGHKINSISPALVQLIGDDNYNEWAGIRCEAKVSMYEDNKYIVSETGELQLTNYGLSGICIMNLSGRIGLGLKKHKEEIKINFIPFISDISKYLIDRNKLIPNRTIIELLESIINYKLLYYILKKSKINTNSKLDELNNKELEILINNLTNYNVRIINTKDITNAQVVTGGLSLTEITNNLESKKQPNLYIAGELLDVDGDCGGYNLGFAWLSGIMIGENI